MKLSKVERNRLELRKALVQLGVPGWVLAYVETQTAKPTTVMRNLKRAMEQGQKLEFEATVLLATNPPSIKWLHQFERGAA